MSSLGLLHEFQVVILAGGDGRRLKPLTNGIPKCLLPVANKALIRYQLEFVHKVGYKEVIVVATHSNEEAVRLHIEDIKQDLDLTVHFHVFDDFLGSAGCLLKLKDLFKSHLIVMSGDLIVEDKFLHHMADLHRAKDAAVTLLTYQEQADPDKDEKQSKPEKSAVIDFFGIDPRDDRLIVNVSSNELEDSEQKLKIRKSLLRRFPNFTLHTNLHDAHFYLLSKWTLDVLEQNKQMMQSIKTHFIPFLVKCQFRKKKTQALKIPSFISPEAYSMATTWNDPEDQVKCFVWRLDSSTYCARVSDFGSYMRINREISAGDKPYLPQEPLAEGKHKNFIAPTAQISSNTQASNSVVGEETTIGERVGVKKTIIGKHCVISQYAKILNSVIMDHVNIAEGAKIQNCVIGPNSYIDPHVTLTDCQLGTGSRVPAGSIWTGKKIAGNQI